MPYVITSSALGGSGRLAASERIVMATIGCGGQGTGDMQGFLGFPQVQMVAVCDAVTGPSRARQTDRQRSLQEPGLQGLQRLPRGPGPARHRRRPDRHARPLARPGHHRGLQERQGRLLREAGMPDHQGRPGHGRRRQPLRPRLLRRQPARAGRLRRLAPAGPRRRARRDQGSILRLLGPVGRLLPRAAIGSRPASTGTSGSARRPGGPSTTA